MVAKSVSYTACMLASFVLASILAPAFAASRFNSLCYLTTSSLRPTLFERTVCVSYAAIARRQSTLLSHAASLSSQGCSSTTASISSAAFLDRAANEQLSSFG